jgi:hypothetical protein
MERDSAGSEMTLQAACGRVRVRFDPVPGTSARSESAWRAIERVRRRGGQREPLWLAQHRVLRLSLEREAGAHDQVRATAEAVLFGVFRFGALARLGRLGRLGGVGGAVPLGGRGFREGRRGEAEKLLGARLGRQDVDAGEQKKDSRAPTKAGDPRSCS